MTMLLESSNSQATKIRVLVVDDSSLIRRMVSRIFESDPEIILTGTARNGIDALSKLGAMNPDVVTLDVEMPEMDGLQTLREISKTYPAVRVIMLSSLTERGTSTTLDALMHGASDYVTKPTQGTELAYEQLAVQLLSKVKQLFPKLHSNKLAASAARANAISSVPASHPPAEICCIGVSTGGPSALYDIWPHFPKNFPLPVVIVQHMPAMFTQMLADRLHSVGSIPVVEGKEGMMLMPGQAVIAPGGFHMRVARQGRELIVTLDEGPKENSCRPAVDVLFRSIVEVLGGRAIAAILTGMGQDGLLGVQALKAKGAVILAQDEATSVVWGMPGAVVAAKVADYVLPLDRIVPEILKSIRYR